MKELIRELKKVIEEWDKFPTQVTKGGLTYYITDFNNLAHRQATRLKEMGYVKIEDVDSK